jgi:hypothetical protein
VRAAVINAAVAVVFRMVRRVMPVVTALFMPRFPFVVLAGILGIKKRRSESASSGWSPGQQRPCDVDVFCERLSRVHLAPIAVDRGDISNASSVPVCGNKVMS